MQTLPGPTPTLIMSAPASISSEVISPVATFPAIIVASGNKSLVRFIASTKFFIYPFATSKPTNPISGNETARFSNTDISSSDIPVIAQMYLHCVCFSHKSKNTLCCLAIQVTILYSCKTSCIPNVPVVSILLAIIGTPVQSF